MKKKLYSKKLWGGRFKKGTNKLVEEITESISFDYRFYKCDIRGSIVHVEMLSKCRIITHVESRRIINALKKIERQITNEIKKDTFKYSISFEDIHTYIEKRLIELVGDEIGTKIHIARSRNDQVALDIRLYIKDDMFEVLMLLERICESIIELAEKYPYVPMPGYTHMQLAKPVYFRDYIRTYFEMFYRDINRIIDTSKRVDYCPLGAGAIGGVHQKVDREYVAKKLGFSEIVKNTIDAVSDRDFVAEYIFDLSMIAMHLSRFSEELIIWVSPEFKFVKIDETFMTGSSILPQKKNPDVCELVRAKSGRVFGNLMSFLTVMKGLPLSYNRDMQEDKPLLFSSSDTVKLALKVYSKMLNTLKVDKKRMLEALRDGFVTAPLLVDHLIQEGANLRKAHEIVGMLVSYCDKNNLNFDRIEARDIKKFRKQVKTGDYEKLSKDIDDDLAIFLERWINTHK